MSAKINFLCEIGTEEIPAGYIAPAMDSMKKIIRSGLESLRIDFSGIEIFATPRRFAVMIDSLAENQREVTEELKGPALKAAYDSDGRPTKALEGFLKANSLSPDSLTQRDTGKGEYVFASRTLKAGKTMDLLPGIINSLVSETAFPKRMKWSDKQLTFPRPIVYFMILFNDKVVPYGIEGILSSNLSRGHYIQSPEFAKIGRISDYESILEKNKVIVNQDRRREMIHKALHEAAAECGGVIHEDAGLLETVTYLVEQPNVIVCEFDRAFLDVPDIALIAEMKEHQKYFPVHDSAGRLTNKFLVVSNNPSAPRIVKGNVKVISARFNDARFFYNEDKKLRLEQRVDSLKSVLFHKELGSIYDKVGRMDSAAGELGGMLGLASDVKAKIKRAVFLCKADLNTAMVYEFASLQGKIGKIYALQDGEDPEVASAIEEHYKPSFQGDTLPGSTAACVLSMAEKFDNIFGSFSVGNIPSGSADPYALRRQANALVELLIAKSMDIDLRPFLTKISVNYKNGGSLIEKIIEFISARARTYFASGGFTHDEIDACLSTGSADYNRLYKIARNVHEFRKGDTFSQMLLGLKRMNNILSAYKKENSAFSPRTDSALFAEKEEKDLHGFFNSRKDEIAGYIKAENYTGLFSLLIEGKPFIDNFFDRVLVMDKDEKIKLNRLSLISGILDNFAGLIDFSKLSDK